MTDVASGGDGFSDGEKLGIRYNQILGLFDRSPLGTGLCYVDGLEIRVVNPAFAESVGVSRDGLKGMGVLDVVAPVDQRDVDRLLKALSRKTNTRHEIAVHWTVADRRAAGRVSFEHIDDTLIGNRPLLTYLHVDHTGPSGAPTDLEPVARVILERIAAGETTSAIARTVDLTVDGVNYHVSRLGRRLGAGNRTALVARAYVLGVLDVSAWPPRVADPKR